MNDYILTSTALVSQNDSKDIIQVPVTYSRHGIPCLWEKGGAYTNIGEARIIGDKYGRPKRAIYIRMHGHLACAEHALIPVRAGDNIVEITRYRNYANIYGYRVSQITECYVELERLEPVNIEMVYAALEKATTYHCRDPFYIRQEDMQDDRDNNGFMDCEDDFEEYLDDCYEE